MNAKRKRCWLHGHWRTIGDRDVHVLVLGDFDATPDSASLSFWRGRRPAGGISVCYQDTWEYLHPDDPGRTFDRENPLVRDGEVATAVSRRIDYILVRAELHGPTLEATACRRILDRPVDGVWASDHYGVMADFTLPALPPGTAAIQGSFPHRGRCGSLAHPFRSARV